MLDPIKHQILAASSAWVAAFLNFLPGLGTGYIYQRRWKAYWITTTISICWVYFDFIRQLSLDPSDPANSGSDLIGLFGLLVISTVSAYEAFLTVKKEREVSTKKSGESS